MARRPRIFASGLLYHVIVRGNHRQRTFRAPADYQAYLERLARFRMRYGVRIYAYCLMPNHVHLLLETSEVPLAKFMQGLQQSYTQYFNREYRKTGHLFQGRYQAIVCEKERYLLGLVRYIHLNPVRAGLVVQPEEYQYSGHGAYVSGRITGVVDPAPVLGLLGGRRAYYRFVHDGIAEGHNIEYYDVAEQQILGAEGFAEQLRAKQTKAQLHRKRPSSLDQAVRALARRVAVEPRVLRSPDRSWGVSRLRTLVAYTLVRRLGFSLSAVAAYMGRDAATTSSLISRLADQLKEKRRIRRTVEWLARIV